MAHLIMVVGALEDEGTMHMVATHPKFSVFDDTNWDITYPAVLQT